MSPHPRRPSPSRLGQVAILALAAVAGTIIGYVDSQPTWDDTGITVGALLVASLGLAALRPRVAWPVGLLVGAPVLLFTLARHGSAASAIALVIGLVGAGIGRALGAARLSR